MYIIDTHTLLWFMNGSSELPAKTRELIGRSDKVYVSIASFWELAIKHSTGKLALHVPVSEIMKAVEQELHFTILPVRAAHLDVVSSLPFHHRDPFDRLLIAQAKAENETLISVDEHFAEYDVNVIWNME